VVVVLVTERLVLRQFTAADVDALLTLDGDRQVMRLDHGTASRERIQTEVLPRLLAYYEAYQGFGFWAAQGRDGGDNARRLTPRA
jgi:RimJ/RimL family protein N-acetyltransferase